MSSEKPASLDLPGGEYADFWCGRGVDENGRDLGWVVVGQPGGVVYGGFESIEEAREWCREKNRPADTPAVVEAKP